MTWGANRCVVQTLRSAAEIQPTARWVSSENTLQGAAIRQLEVVPGPGACRAGFGSAPDRELAADVAMSAEYRRTQPAGGAGEAVAPPEQLRRRRSEHGCPRRLRSQIPRCAPTPVRPATSALRCPLGGSPWSHGNGHRRRRSPARAANRAAHRSPRPPRPGSSPTGRSCMGGQVAPRRCARPSDWRRTPGAKPESSSSSSSEAPEPTSQRVTSPLVGPATYLAASGGSAASFFIRPSTTCATSVALRAASPARSLPGRLRDRRPATRTPSACCRAAPRRRVP